LRTEDRSSARRRTKRLASERPGSRSHAAAARTGYSCRHHTAYGRHSCNNPAAP
jgi:hypothetical protein